MRKILSKEELERKKKRNNIILVLVLGAVMVFGTLGFALQGSGNLTTTNGGSEVDYHGFKFLNQNGFWYLGNFTFSNTPPDIANQTTTNVSLGLKQLSSYQGLPLYIYSEDPSSEAEADTNFALVALRIQRACPAGMNCTSSSLPIKTCSDNFIIIEAINSTSSTDSSIIQDNNCVYIRGPQEDLLALTDQFLFKALGVM